MRWVYVGWIVVATILGGLIPVWFKKLQAHFMVYLLVFSGAFLFGITALHLLPEVYRDLGAKAGIFIVLGFFLQILIQMLSHGVEHGHRHDPTHDTHIGSYGLLAGLSLHAFMDGIPLGLTYSDPHSFSAIAFGIMAHKLPDGMALMSMLLYGNQTIRRNLMLLILFALATPAGALLSFGVGMEFHQLSMVLGYLVAIVAGAFLQISSVILFESGTKNHELNTGKSVSMLVGVILAILTIYLV